MTSDSLVNDKWFHISKWCASPVVHGLNGLCAFLTLYGLQEKAILKNSATYISERKQVFCSFPEVTQTQKSISFLQIDLGFISIKKHSLSTFELESSSLHIFSGNKKHCYDQRWTICSKGCLTKKRHLLPLPRTSVLQLMWSVVKYNRF